MDAFLTTVEPAATLAVIAPLLSNFKDTTVSRGLNYHYYFSPPASGKPTLLLVHGFPSLAVDWHPQINYFKGKGYGLVVPDQLGYGGTDKPKESKAYVHSRLAQDLVDIIDHENVTDVIAIGHDWYVHICRAWLVSTTQISFVKYSGEQGLSVFSRICIRIGSLDLASSPWGMWPRIV